MTGIQLVRAKYGKTKVNSDSIANPGGDRYMARQSTVDLITLFDREAICELLHRSVSYRTRSRNNSLDTKFSDFLAS